MALAIVALLSLAGIAAAAADIDCTEAMTQQEMNICARQSFEAIDAELNIVWKQARKVASDLDAGFDEAMRGADTALLAGQRGWIAYRDGQCEVAGWDAHGGTMEPMLVSGCMETLTRARVEELKEFIRGSNR